MVPSTPRTGLPHGRPALLVAGLCLALLALLVCVPSVVAHGDSHGHIKMDSGLMETGASFSYVFDVEAIYDYGSTNHFNVTGVVFVEPDAPRSGDVQLVIKDYAYQEKDGDGFVPAKKLYVRPNTMVTWTVLDDTDETGPYSVSLFNFKETEVETEESPGPVVPVVVAVLAGITLLARHRRGD